jgi:hypothetical protein
MNYSGNAKSVEGLMVYEVWRDRFLRDRLRPAVRIAIFFILTIMLYFGAEAIWYPQDFKIVDLYTTSAIELGLLTCLVLQKPPSDSAIPVCYFWVFRGR